ncbi:arsenate reductase family protein [Euzebya tangerina]|uniref:arsenate reductase family protein n=1 Tax=Euzebya tangerina TaxID=591198 RepID=UPI000E31849D|nr:ArsC/Spx/MgsR family protein [Euzebya tangerina]
MSDLQLFISPKHKVARKAERFFKERGLPYHAVDVRQKAPSPGELRKWVQRFGVEAVLDKDSKTYVESGLQYFSAGEEDWIERMCRHPEVLNLPLVRCGKELSVGDDPASWKRFVAVLKGS